jgi:hypothetical protein
MSDELETVMFSRVNPYDPYGKITVLLIIFVIEVMDK